MVFVATVNGEDVRTDESVIRRDGAEGRERLLRLLVLEFG